ncbi:MAG: metalloregulator ArsR/SmtB family transcription factor [Jannaschia sp.]
MTYTTDTAAEGLAALGHAARLAVFRLLVRAGPDGLRVGDVAAHLDLAPSTLAHHMRGLVQAGLVTQTRAGREVWLRVDFDATRTLLGFLTEECCCGVTLQRTDAA